MTPTGHVTSGGRASILWRFASVASIFLFIWGGVMWGKRLNIEIDNPFFSPFRCERR